MLVCTESVCYIGNTMNHIDVVGNLSVLRSLDRAVIADRLRRGAFRIVEHDRANVVHLADDECTTVEVVVEGELSVDHIEEDGELHAVAVFMRDDLIGANVYFSSNQRYPVTVVAKTNVTLLSMDGEALFEIIKHDGRVLRLFLQAMSANTTMLNSRILAGFGPTLRKRLLAFLCRKAEGQKGVWIPFGMTKTRLADLLGVRRTSLSRELGKLRSQRILRFDRTSFCIDKLDCL